MATHDLGHKLTDKELAALEKRIASVYKDARDGLNDTISEYFAKFVDRDKHQQELLKAGKITEEQYKQWRLNQIGRGKRYEALRDEIAKRYTEANQVAVSYVNDATPGIYSLNRNYAAYTIEKEVGNVGFNLFDEQTVKRLIVEEPNLMPYYPKKRAVARGIDLAWGKQQITASVTSGILQGYSVGKIADDLQERMEKMNRASALRTARTAITGAQNAGRQDSYIAAEKMGIKMKREWLATLDNRTRHAHAVLDGQRVGVNEPFKVDGYEIMFPGDPTAKAYLVYNCRCTVVVEVDGPKDPNAMRRAIDPVTGESVMIPDMTFAQWQAWKESENAYAWEVYMKKGRNASADKKQHEKYRSILGSKIPERLEDFQDLKYNNTEKWEYAKLDYARRSKLAKNPEMALPNAGKATAPEGKFTKYLFDPESKRGWPKGRAIISRLGYSSDNWGQMRAEILRGAELYPSNKVGSNEYGDLYEQRMVLYGKKDTPANVIVGWIVKEDGSVSMTTAYIKEVK